MAENKPQVQCRVRVTRGEDIALGPGKMQLLAAIAAAGSISGGAREMRMSYRRAWLLGDAHELSEMRKIGRAHV